jgi:hypothetical protein
MKLQLVLLSTLLVVPLLDAKPVEAKTKHVRAHPVVASNAPAGRDYQSVMAECEGMYAGNRGYLGRDRYVYIEQCFKNITGKSPADLQVNCTLRRC